MAAIEWEQTSIGLSLFFPRSERGGGPAGVLADEAEPRRRPAERRPGCLRNGSLQQPSVRLLRQSSRRQLLRQLPGTTLAWSFASGPGRQSLTSKSLF